MAKEEWDKVVQELSLASEWLSIEKERAEMPEASLAIESAHFSESTTKYVELHCLLAKAWSQREKDLAKM